MINLEWNEEIAREAYNEEGFERGMAQGIEKGVISSLKNLIKNARMLPEEAMNMLGIPKEEQLRYAAMLG